MQNAEHQEILTSLIDDIKPQIGENAWRDWFLDISITYSDGYILNFPNKFISEWVNNKYSNLINSAAQKIGIKVKVGINTNESTSLPTKKINKSTQTFNSSFTFENFIVGNSNIMAYEAANRVATSLEISFNPLFIHSSVGLGKTHLLHAIANARNKKYPDQKILYLSAEQFMNMFVKSIVQKNTMEFKDEFRSADLLLIDDFQFLGSKEATQEEFFHTFNTLLENKKQLVICADKDPSLLPGVEARLKSRLGWGLVADIHPATYELKLGILKNKAQQSNINIPAEILSYIAKEINTSIRELEGAFLKVIKYAEWTNSQITLETTKMLLKNRKKAENNPVNLINSVCHILNIDLEEIKSTKRTRNIARARQKIIYILRKNLGTSYLQIAKMLGNKDHTSIIYSDKQAQKLLQEDEFFAADINKIKQELEL